MKTTYMLALAMLAVIVFAGGSAYADVKYNTQTNQCCPAPQVSQPAATGSGPCPCGVIVTGIPASDCCNVAPAGTCGAFCRAGQTAPGWPYNWCSEYWLRPNTNF